MADQDNPLGLAPEDNSRNPLDVLYPKGWAGGLFGQGNLAVDMANPLADRQDVAERLAGGMAAPIKAFHGTPYTFEPVEHNPFGEFQNVAIGSGEGAQAYGWGHYLAGNQGVAKSYQTSSGSPSQLYLDGQPMHSDEIGDIDDPSMEQAVGAIYRHRGDETKAQEYLQQQKDTVQEDQFNPEEEAKFIKQWKEPTPEVMEEQRQNFEENRNKQLSLTQGAMDWIKNNPGRVTIPESSLLSVHIKPDEDQLLDWDKPLAEQSGDIQDKFADIVQKTTPDGSAEVHPATAQAWEQLHESGVGSAATGRDLYTNLKHDIMRNLYSQSGDMKQSLLQAPALASEQLHEAGIPGIKYLDQGSRKAGSGTSNYVIFHPDNLVITGRNGQELPPEHLSKLLNPEGGPVPSYEAVDHDPFAFTTEPVDHDPFGVPE